MDDSEVRDDAREHPFFAGMSPRQRAVITDCARLVRIPTDDYLFRLGEPASEFYLLRQGRVGLRWPNRNITFLTLHENDLLGVSWAAPPRLWTCDAIAYGFVSALAVDATRLQIEWENDRAFGYACLRRILSVFQSRIDEAVMQSLDLYGN
jgi:CRP/FNR family cyclic AMP-dependent transcriptional regulator